MAQPAEHNFIFNYLWNYNTQQSHLKLFLWEKLTTAPTAKKIFI